MDYMDCLPHMEFFASQGLALLQIRCDPAAASLIEIEGRSFAQGRRKGERGGAGGCIRSMCFEISMLRWISMI